MEEPGGLQSRGSQRDALSIHPVWNRKFMELLKTVPGTNTVQNYISETIILQEQTHKKRSDLWLPEAGGK